MQKIIEVFVNRRGWVALLPAIVMVSGLFGVEITEEMLTTAGDQILVGIMGALGLWSLFAPKS